MTKEQELKNAKRVCFGISALGYTAYLAGGCVRDLLLSRVPKDFDIASDAPTEVLKQTFRTFDAGGEKYGVTHILVEGAKFEVAMFREDGEYSDGRRPDSVRIATPETDARRRDFTINALFLDPSTDKVIDYVGGCQDLQKKIIKTVGDPTQRFMEDHLRIMRAIRFSSELGFEIENETFYKIFELAHKIKRVSGERIRAELMKILHSDNPKLGLSHLYKSGILEHILPEVQKFAGCKQPPEFHPEGDVWEHTLTMLYLMNRGNLDQIFPLAVLLHDIGKPPTQVFEQGRFRFRLHEEIGKKLCEPIMRRLSFSTDEIEKVQFLVGNHMRVKHLKEMSKCKKKKLMRHPMFFDLMELHRLDCLSSGKPDDLINHFIEEARNMPPEQLRPTPLIGGDDLIALGFQPGPIMGKILRAIDDSQLDGYICTKEEALAFAKEYQEKPVEDVRDRLGEDDD